MKRWIGALVGMAFLLVGCGAVTPVPEILSETPAATWTVTKSSTSTLTQTPTPDARGTALAAAIASHQPFPFPTRTPDATARAIATANGHGSARISPDRQWVAVSMERSLEVYRLDGVQRWSIPCGELFEQFGDICWYVFPVHWTNNSRYLYFAPAVLGEASVPYSMYVGIAMIDVETGEWGKLVEDAPLYVDTRYVFSVSPNGVFLAYVDFYVDPAVLVVLDMRTREELVRHEVSGPGGDIVWSPSSSEFVFVIWGDGSMTVSLCDLASGGVRELLRDEERVLQLFLWDAEDRVLLEKTNYQTGMFDPNAPSNEYWYLNPFTGELTPVTTPTP